jgi:uncharacterized protein
MQDTLSYIVTSIVDNPDKVEIREEEADGVLNLIVSVAKEDMGKVIGREGKVIRAIRNVMKIKAMKQNARINITLTEELQS